VTSAAGLRLDPTVDTILVGWAIIASFPPYPVHSQISVDGGVKS